MTTTSNAETSEQGTSEEGTSRPKVLCLRSHHDSDRALFDRFRGEFELVEVSSPVRALALLKRDDFIGIYADVGHFAKAVDAGQLLHNERILKGMPDGVVLLAPDNSIVWGNGKLREWSGRNNVIGANFYDVLGSPGNLGA